MINKIDIICIILGTLCGIATISFIWVFESNLLYITLTMQIIFLIVQLNSDAILGIMEEVFILTLEERNTIRNIIGKCSNEFKRDMTMGREPLFDELQLLEALMIMKMERWSYGDLHKLNDVSKQKSEVAA